MGRIKIQNHIFSYIEMESDIVNGYRDGVGAFFFSVPTGREFTVENGWNECFYTKIYLYTLYICVFFLFMNVS